MIPIELHLRNFLSYGEEVPSLDFTSFKLACLSGRNGHGKSALLDAITWAVWGKARKTGRGAPDSYLLRQNADEMAVDFTFLLNGREYQISREYLRKRDVGKLEFRVRDPQDPNYIVLTTHHKTQTQERIIQTLGLDYETFINSSFLQQGKADEFTRKSPKERKEILCSILGLDYYDRLLDETKLRLKAVTAERQMLSNTLEIIERELDEEADIREEETRLNTAIEEKENALKTGRDTLAAIQKQISFLEQIHQQVEREREESILLKKRRDELANRQIKRRKEQQEVLALIQRKEEIFRHYERYQEIGRALHALLEVDEQFQKLDAQRHALERRIDEQRTTLKEKLAALKSEQDQMRKTREEWQPVLNTRPSIEEQYARFQKTLSLQKQLESIKPRFDELQKQLLETENRINLERQQLSEEAAELRGATQSIPKLENEIAASREKLSHKNDLESSILNVTQKLQRIEEEGHQNNDAMARNNSQCEQSKSILQETHEKIQLLQSGGSQHCPLCDSQLDDTKRRHLLERLQEEIQTHQSILAQSEKEIHERTELRKRLLETYQITKTFLEQKKGEQQRLLLLENELTIRENERRARQNDQEKLQALSQRIETGDFAQENRRFADQYRMAIQQTAYSPQQHEQVNQQLNRERPFEQEWHRLQDILERLTPWENRERELCEALALLQRKIDNDDFAQEDAQRRQTVLKNMDPLRQSLNQRKELQEEHKRLQSAPAEWSQLQAAEKRLPEIEQDLHQGQTDQRTTEERLAAIETQRQNAAPALQEFHSLQERHEKEEQSLACLEEERGELQIQLGGIRQRLDYLQTRKTEQKENQERLASTNRDEHLYKILSNAFSRNGIPALIVEQVLPELENDANQILHRLTQGRCSVALESQREKKSGGMSETLDIKISDEMGTRDYELFSGGEAFRTDLALRIALSQLLCRRAGSKLQLLVIDEGFGTQDSEGLNNIVEAIHEIQDDFEKILMVTHLDELKEKFQVRIEVTKELGIGSRFEIIHTL